MINKKSMKICIIGGGISGLALACFLKRVGFNSFIYERANQIGQGGYGFLLLKNGLTVLEHVGLKEKIDVQGNAIRQLHLKNEIGMTLDTKSLEDVVCISRTTLSAILGSQISSIHINTQHEFTHFVRDKNGFATHACFTNGEKVAADFFVAADGTRSLIRSIIDPDFEMPPVQIKELVSCVQITQPLEQNTLVKLQHSQGQLAVGYAPISINTFIWYIQFFNERWNFNDRIDKQHFVQELVGHFPEPVPTLIKATNFSHSHVWNTTNMRKLPNICENNILLIGDAAHTFSPFSSQGVNTALQDAFILAQLLARSASLEKCLDAYQETRQPNTLSLLQVGEQLINNFLAPQADSDPFIPLAL